MTNGAQPMLCTRVEKASTLRRPTPLRQPSSTRQWSLGASTHLMTSVSLSKVRSTTRSANGPVQPGYTRGSFTPSAVVSFTSLQSSQSVPKAHKSYSAPGPPSSHTPSSAYL
eukprot:scaffold106388_cov57-Phaeocystis_antarctica.AAC.5